METFKAGTGQIQLIQLLKALNWAESGGIAKLMVEEGLVKVNGVAETRKRKKLIPGDIVDVNDRSVKIL
ncbi:MAG: RNA-binding S4 domain-containing protein [Bacteroidales bacterium]|nr:RNA-binding S4 domain-containing protein [Bacteroidales bacterium]